MLEVIGYIVMITITLAIIGLFVKVVTYALDIVNNSDD